MKYAIKMTATVFLTVAVIIVIQFVYSILTLGVGERYDGDFVSVHRFGYSLYSVDTPIGSSTVNTANAESALKTASEYGEIIALPLPESARLLAEHLSGRLSHIGEN